mgnify:CR=1 FL=1
MFACYKFSFQMALGGTKYNRMISTAENLSRLNASCVAILTKEIGKLLLFGNLVTLDK